MTSPEDNPDILIARGPLNPSDKGLITSFLGRFGLEVEHTSEEVLNERYQINRPISYVVDPLKNYAVDEDALLINQLTSSEDFLAREHIDHWATIEPMLPQGSYGRLFNYLVDGEPSKQGRWQLKRDSYDEANDTWIHRNPDTPDLLLAVPRIQVGLDKYAKKLHKDGRNNFCASFVVQVGSIITFADNLKSTSNSLKINTTSRHIIYLAKQLESQIK